LSPRLVIAVLGLTFCQFPLSGQASTTGADRPSLEKSSKFDSESALKFSQGAIGGTVGDHSFIDRDGKKVNLADFRGKPLVISLVYSSCYHVCPTTTRYLAKAVVNARAALGTNSFNVVTIGFDTIRDTPEMMRAFARQQQVDLPGWKFLSTDQATIDKLSKEVGFIYYPSPTGFDHLLQSTLVDKNGRVYGQVYGIAGSEYDTPRLVEPLKKMVFGDTGDGSLLTTLSNRVRLFCTVYDPQSGAYYFDYSLFVGIAIGLLILFSIIFWLLREWRSLNANTR